VGKKLSALKRKKIQNAKRKKYRIALKSLVTGPLASNKCEGSRQTTKREGLVQKNEKIKAVQSYP
jgi:hypothetical protein